MPIYNYECEVCHHQFELRQGFGASSEADCPRCSGRAKRRISPVAVIFKGSGWYVNDYAHKNSTLSGNGHKESSEPPAEASVSKEESKPKEEKPPSKEP